MIDRFYVRDVEVLSPTAATDRYGSNSPTWSTSGRRVRGWLSQMAQVETPAQGRAALVTDLILFLPADTRIDGRSRVVVDDVTYQVDGQPHEAWAPSGPHHLEVRLQEVAG